MQLVLTAASAASPPSRVTGVVWGGRNTVLTDEVRQRRSSPGTVGAGARLHQPPNFESRPERTRRSSALSIGQALAA